MILSKTMQDRLFTGIFVIMLIVSGLLAWENITLKGTFATAGRGTDRAEIEPGDRLRAMDVVSESGVRRTLFREGASSPMLLLIFNTSCPHCENSVSAWNQLAGLGDGNRFEILGVSMDDTSRSRDYIARNDVRFPVASIADVEYMREHRINGVPTTILVGPDATVMQVWPGEITPGVFLDIARRLTPAQND
jgi:peroxiredoxin